MSNDDEAHTAEPRCEVCGKEPMVSVAAVPGVPISVAYGRECLRAGAHPYGIVVANTALVGGFDCADTWWQGLVTHTLQHLGTSREQFDVDVTEAIRLMDEAGKAAAEEGGVG